MSPELVAVGPQDWQAWRDLRLEALLDTPIGFVRTYAKSVAYTEQQWRDWLSRPGGFWLVREQGRPVAMAAVWQDGRCWLGAVFVTPAARGRGLLAALVEAAADWAREQGEDELHLEVHEDNARARRAYERLGFVATGEQQPYPLPPGGQEIVMVRPL